MPRLLYALGVFGFAGCAGSAPFTAHLPTVATTHPAIQSVSESPQESVPVPAPMIGLANAEQSEIDQAEVSLSGIVPVTLLEDGTTVTPIKQSVSYGAVSIDDSIDMNLPSALAMIGGSHPAVGVAQWRVREAYATLARAEALWLPSIQGGLSFHRHDGNYQASDGSIIDVNRNSFQYGLGTGATGAGTTPRPGLVAQFHLADAIFQPEIAEKTAWAQSHAASAVVNRQLLTAANAYIDLLDAHQDNQIVEQSRQRMADLSSVTSDFAEAGEGLKADAKRMQTELSLIQNRVVASQERIALASARLAQAISLDSRASIRPMDVTVVPIDLAMDQNDKSQLISMGLATRPELKESQALVAAACEAYQREKFAPFVPSVLMGFSTGGFGGGIGNSIDNVDGRYDVDALMSWQIRNLGLGERAARQESSSRVQQARYEKLRVMDQVALEVSEAHAQIQFRRQQISITEQAIQTAQQSFDLNLSRIRDGQGLPLEVLQSLQTLETAQRAYLRAVVDHNQSQFQLQWALGWPVTTPSGM
ncbi:Outer membrane efflux protein [Rubripirellula tenax]|uniref:Outer membrane efflux protein n=1 Tax=Rubripirellula tenax TaxID=2528015 RepID=A0A5C6EEJ6_9BACT|nr:TolC family protein [Rubripirellula tenax]TWU47258.1 Outer membrane efflux protein [Rubripirellula tenax]